MNKPIPDIMNGIQLNANQCIVSLDESGTGWIVARNEQCRQKDILPECCTEDNGFNTDWDQGLAVGLYLLTLQPWSYYDDRTGEYDCGVDVKKVEPLWVIGEKDSETKISFGQMEYLPPVWINTVPVPNYQKVLEPGWDGYGGVLPTEAAINTARYMALVPGGDGTLQYEIHAGGCDVEISISDDGSINHVYSTCGVIETGGAVTITCDNSQDL